MDKNWIELRADYERRAAYSYGDSGQTYEEAKEKAFDLLETTRLGLYRDKVMQVVENGYDTQEKVIHEEHPTVLEVDIPKGCVTALPYDLTVL